MGLRSYCLLGIAPGLLLFGCAGLPPGWAEYRAAMACDMEGKAQECDKSYEKAIKKNGKLQGVHASYGTHLLKRGEVQPAQKEYAKEQEYHPVSTTAVGLALKNVAQRPPAPASPTEAKP